MSPKSAAAKRFGHLDPSSEHRLTFDSTEDCLLLNYHDDPSHLSLADISLNEPSNGPKSISHARHPQLLQRDPNPDGT
jgi:hypothetical protein